MTEAEASQPALLADHNSVRRDAIIAVLTVEAFIVVPVGCDREAVARFDGLGFDRQSEPSSGGKTLDAHIRRARAKTRGRPGRAPPGS